MNAGDIRSMFLEKIGPLRKRLLRNDRDDKDRVTNVFLDRVTKNANGLPIYVTYVIGDVLAGRYRALDAGELLPPSLDSYHEELLQRCAIGSLHQVITPLATTIATAHEALDSEALTSILIRRTVVPPGRKGSDLVLRGLSAISAMLRRVSTPLGTDGFTLFHHSLRQHMHANEAVVDAMDLSRTSLKQVCSEWHLLDEPLRGYAIRNLGVHYLDDEDAIGIAEQVSTPEAAQILLPSIEQVMRVRLSQCNEQRENSVVVQTMRLLADIPGLPVANMLVDLFDHGFMSVGGWFNRFCVENLQQVIERAAIDRRMLGWIRSIGTFDTMGAAAEGRGEPMAEIAMELAEKHPEEPLSAFVVVVVASKRPLNEAVKLCEKACEMASITGDPVAIWETEANRFRYNFDLWRLAEAREAATKTIAALPPTDRSFRTFLAQDNLAKVAMRSGDFQIAARALAISSTAPVSIGEVPRAYSRGYLGTLLGHLGQKTEARRLLEQVTPIVSEAHGRAGLFFSSPWLEFAMESEDLNSASRAAAKVESDVDAKKDMGWWSQEVVDFQLLARYYLHRGDLPTAQIWLAAAERVNKREPYEGYTIGTLQVKAELALHQNHHQEAISLAEQAYLTAERLDVGSKTPLLADLLARIHQSANNPNEMKKWQEIAEQKRERWQVAKALEIVRTGASV
ncbi:MAG: tetratricopeptide repeat protein [Methanotrichaceae archaeon]